MFRSKKNDLLAGLLVSALLSLFVNFSLLMRIYDRVRSGGMNFFEEPGYNYYLYFSFGWFFVFSFLLFLLTVQLYRLGASLGINGEFKVFLFSVVFSLVISFFMIQLFPVLQHTIMVDIAGVEMKPPIGKMHGMKPGQTDPEEFPDPPMPFFKPVSKVPFPRPLVTEHLFVFVTITLSVLLIRLLNTRQEMTLAFEKLKTEKLQTSYNALMGQINPHFFFNSLNGLNSLIRGGEQDKTLTYLDELSNVFRYILQSNKKEMVTLAEELQFVKAYTYLLSVRYEGKLFFSIQADKDYFIWYLPILSVLPLIENAVKHNVISKQYPLQIDIYTTDSNMLVVSNKIQPKNEEMTSSGIGLKNLWGRYRMLTGKDIHITNHKEYFKVSLPLLNTLPKLG